MKQPKIRFKGFSGEWKTRTLGSLGTVAMCKRIFKNQTTDKGEIPFYKIGTFGAEPDAFITRDLYEEYKRKFKFPKIGDILISAAGTIGRTVEYLGEEAYYQDSNIVWLNHNDEIKNSFLKHLYSVITWKGLEGATVKRLYNSIILDTEVKLPSKEEQQALGAYFQHLDTLVLSTAKKIESLKQVKAASLQSMFPQDGETTPRVRFKGFEGEWSKRNFADIFTYVKNNSFSRDQLNYIEGEVKNVHYGDVLIKFGDIIDSQIDMLPYVTGLKENAISQIAKLQDGDVIIADAAEDNTVGKCSEIINVGNSCILSGLHTIACRPIIHFALGYLGRYINSNLYHNQLLPLIQGSKISSISKHVIKQTEVMFPSYAEQQQIANYFTSLDSQITLQSQRLEKLKQIKSACLDNMFV